MLSQRSNDLVWWIWHSLQYLSRAVQGLQIGGTRCRAQDRACWL